MTAHFTYDLNPVEYIVADAVGEPGQRTFFLQARQGRKTVSLIMEKQQVAALAASVLQLLEELEQQNPDLSPADVPDTDLHLVEPLKPAFRVGQIGLGYDETHDLIVIVAQALNLSELEEETEMEAEAATVESAPTPTARFFATRNQMQALGEHALRVVSAGRPECPLCGRPIDPSGHFCPRTNGHAYPLAF
jgi:uncharacterized repeat protein (TIGR03847 family)